METKAMVSPYLFQFHKGTIKTIMNTFNTINNFNFNSIKVRLKLFVGLGYSCDLFEFQFHKGTITQVSDLDFEVEFIA